MNEIKTRELIKQNSETKRFVFFFSLSEENVSLLTTGRDMWEGNLLSGT